MKAKSLYPTVEVSSPEELRAVMRLLASVAADECSHWRGATAYVNGWQLSTSDGIKWRVNMPSSRSGTECSADVVVKFMEDSLRTRRGLPPMTVVEHARFTHVSGCTCVHCAVVAQLEAASGS